jgi:Flp pilus assembly pilin Flp
MKMHDGWRLLRSRVRGQDGASSVEYGLLITGIAALVAVAVFAFGAAVSSLFETTISSL